MANAARQEVDLVFGGKTYTVKPTFEVIAGVELATGKSCIALARKCFTQDPDGYPSLTETGQIVFNVLRSFGGPSAERVGEIIMDDGCIGIWVPLGNILSRALRGNKDHMKQAAEAAQNEIVTDPPQDSSTPSNG